ncbi:PAS domain S-box-containing protein [Bosea sp. BK604]|nr:PAS domain S-box-containing protein [Bosea sp. BK604]
MVARTSDETASGDELPASPLDVLKSRIVGANGSGPVRAMPHAPDPRDWLAAIIDGSDDAIISKDLEGNIQSWNGGATRLLGYSEAEVLGRPITILIPESRLDEEPAILAEIRRGNRVDHFETVRMRKDGSLVDLSLTISPIRNAEGAIVGASKIARDITERRQAQEKQRLLYGEMQHRVKNLFALAAGIVSLTARSGGRPQDLARIIHERLAALARAHQLTMPDWTEEGLSPQSTTLLALVKTIVEPYGGHKIDISGIDSEVGSEAVTHVALLLHELTTNAAKYGALSASEGRLEIRTFEAGGSINLEWTELGGPVTTAPSSSGFGTRLENGVLTSLDATIRRDWRNTGLVVTIEIPREKLAA